MPQPPHLQQLEEIPYPAAPWNMKGQLWMGTFKSDAPVQLPTGLNHFLDPNTLVVILVRYLEGTLSYDEFAIGTLTRLGPRIGVYVDAIWVNSLASVWGGRRIWGLPKNLAEFAWQGSTVRVTDEQGLIATVTVDTSPIDSPKIWMPMPGVGQLENNQFVFTVGQLWARLGKGHMHIDEWPTRFGYHLGSTPTFSMAAKPFQMTVPAGKVLK
jgi:hypothetical protein